MKLSLAQLARCLDLPPSTIERWISQGRIPIQLTGSACVFNQSALEKWANSHNLRFTPHQRNQAKPRRQAPETLQTAMAGGGVFYQVPGETVAAVLQSAVDGFAWLPDAGKQSLLEKLIERERLTSTGIGKGVAIPHPRSPLAVTQNESLIATCFLETPIDFGSVDDRPVFVLFIILGPSVQQHLHLLSRLSFCVRDNAFIAFLKTQPEKDQLFSKIADFEIELDRAES